MATHSSVLAWRIPGTGEPGGLLSMGSPRVGHDWSDLAAAAAVHSKGDQPRDFFGRNDAKAEIPVLGPPHAKSWLIGKDSDAGRDWGQEEKGMTEDEMAGWHHWLNGREFELRELVMDREAWRAAIHGVTKSRTQQSDWTGLSPYHLESNLFILQLKNWHPERVNTYSVLPRLIGNKARIQTQIFWLIYLPASGL